MMARKRKPPIGQTIGGVLFGFEQQIFRNVPPPHELVHRARPDTPVPAGDGSFLTFEVPSAPTTVEDPMAEPEIRDVAEQPAVGVHVHVPMAEVDIGALAGRWLPAIADRLAERGIGIAGAPFVRYHGWGGETADLDIGIPVDRPAEELPAIEDTGEETLGSLTLPAGPAAVLVHVGPYTALPGSWDRISTWMGDHGHEWRAAPWESYVDDPDEVAVDELRTEIVHPVRPAS